MRIYEVLEVDHRSTAASSCRSETEVTWGGLDVQTASVSSLTRKQEQTRNEPWNVTDAPEPFITSQLRGIIGLEIPITRIEGKWKVSQNRP